MLVEWSDLVEWPGILLVLSFTFLVFFFGGLTVGLALADCDYLVGTLEWNPNRYLDYMRNAFVFLILPPAVGLAFSVIGFVRERRDSSNGLRGLSCLPLMVVGGFLSWWGVHGVWWNYDFYLDAIHYAERWSVDLAEPLLKLYATAGVGFILWLIVGLLWLVAGLLLMLSQVFKVMLRKKDTPQQSSFAFCVERALQRASSAQKSGNTRAQQHAHQMRKNPKTPPFFCCPKPYQDFKRLSQR